MRLTKATAERLELPPGKTELVVFDDALPGFGLRIRAGGRRSWIVQFRLGSKQRRLTLGTVNHFEVDEARKHARDALARARLGRDPQLEKAAARVPKPREMTLGDVVDRYLPYAERKLKPSTYSGVARHLRQHWRALHAHELQNLERRHVAAELGRIATTSGLYSANRSRAALSAVLTWAIGEGLCDSNPVVGTNKATEEVARDRVLSDEELAAIWNEAGGGDYGAIVRLLILTGQRREEVGGMLWPEIDLEAAMWRIASERTKNARPHEVPLSLPTVEILRTRDRSDRALVFGSRKGPFQGFSAAKAALDGRMSAALVHAPSPWRLHDVRRTVATRMADLGVQPHVVEAVLNHAGGHRAGLAGVYNRSSYANEKRRALDLWAAHVGALVEGRTSKVVSLAARAG